MTPSAIAERWSCSERHVRNLIKSGELPSFRLGMKLIRVRISDLEAFECRNGVSLVCAESSVSPGQTGTSADATASGLPIPRRRPAAPRLDMPNSRVREAQASGNSGKPI
ncbi:helix-turn-helix domain-containing protein [Chelativorans sp. ZYF759]|uniref:helix-turn-helix domain-containing protein n=1 Tax=Chelativorans sp. ZYF759 TaxID=2692213 RepID=UPI00145E363A|nr:helix-turn-helix domain-containing protein [Chelativorans sp. ZYF759]